VCFYTTPRRTSKSVDATFILLTCRKTLCTLKYVRMRMRVCVKIVNREEVGFRSETLLIDIESFTPPDSCGT
jgi:hypothetical protein